MEERNYGVYYRPIKKNEIAEPEAVVIEWNDDDFCHIKFYNKEKDTVNKEYYLRYLHKVVGKTVKKSRVTFMPY
jgi:hypothetical protein